MYKTKTSMQNSWKIMGLSRVYV